MTTTTTSPANTMTPDQSAALSDQLHQQHPLDDTVLDMEDTAESHPGTPLISGQCQNKRSDSPSSKRSFSGDENANDQHGGEKDALMSVVTEEAPATKKPTGSFPSQNHSEEQESAEMHFHVGPGRQLMIGKAFDLASISPVFRAAVEPLWCPQRTEEGQQIEMEIPAVGTQEFGIILRCASESGATDHLPVTDDNVWIVLKAADMYQVVPVVRHCFHHLLNKHKCRNRSRHVCMVMELAHTLNYPDHHAECLQRAQRKARQIFKSKSGLSELCRDCMLRLIKADRLSSVRNETLVYYAVVEWALCHFAERHHHQQGKEAAAASWEELRDVAGELVHHVRFLSMPQEVLNNLGCIGGHQRQSFFFSHASPTSPNSPSSCLLTKDEIEQFLSGQAPKGFTDRADKRIDMAFEEKLHSVKKAIMDGSNGSACRCLDNSTDIVSCVFLIGLGMLFLFALLYVPIVLAVRGGHDDDI